MVPCIDEVSIMISIGVEDINPVLVEFMEFVLKPTDRGIIVDIEFCILVRIDSAMALRVALSISLDILIQFPELIGNQNTGNLSGKGVIVADIGPDQLFEGII